MKDIRERAADIPRFLTVVGVADLLHPEPRTMREMLAYGHTPHRRTGRVLVFGLNEIPSLTQRLRKPWAKEN